MDDDRRALQGTGTLEAMPPPVEWKARCEHPTGLVRPVPLDPAGLDGPTRGQARGGAWRRTGHGMYVPAHVDPTVPEQRILEAAVHLPEGGAVTGWAACRWLGAGYFDGLQTDGATELPVPLACGPEHNLRSRTGIQPTRDRLEPDEVRVLRGVPCAVPERATFDAMRRAEDVREAVVAMDMMAAAELSSVARMRRYLEGRAGWNGLPQVRDALDMAAEESRAPTETRLRLVWTLDAGLPAPRPNAPVFDLKGRLIGIADLFDPVAGLVGEYDGAAHRGAGRHHRDVVREDRFRRAGLEYVKVTSLDLLDIERLVDRVLAARVRALALPRSRWSWTLQVPDGWYDDPLDSASLDERLEHREWILEQRRAQVAPIGRPSVADPP